MFIAVDKNQFSGSHEQSNRANHDGLKALGHTLVTVLLPYGDYARLTPEMTDIMTRRGNKMRRLDLAGSISTVIDRKANVSELAQNMCSTAEEHERFHTEYTLARQCGCRFFLLVEDDHIRSLDDLEQWENPRRKRWEHWKEMESKGYTLKRPLPKRPPVDGKALAKALRTIEERYGVKTYFCTPQEAPSAIAYLLTH